MNLEDHTDNITVMDATVLNGNEDYGYGDPLGDSVDDNEDGSEEGKLDDKGDLTHDHHTEDVAFGDL